MYPYTFPIVIAQDPAPRCLTKYCSKLNVFSPSVLKINPLNPMGQDLNSCINSNIDVLSFALNFWGGARAYLEKIIHEVYKKYGEYPYFDKCPSLFELRDELTKLKAPYGRESEYINGLKIKLNGLLLASGDLFDCQLGINLDKIMQGRIPTVLEIPDGLGKDHRAYLILYIVSWIYLYKKTRKDNSLVVIFLDEASDIFGKKSPSDEVPYIIQNILVTCRQYGIAFVVSSQIYSQLNISIRANSFIKIFNNTNLGQDLTEIDQTLLLKGEQRGYARRLKLGEALVLDGRIPDPFLITVPEFQRPPVTEEDIIKSTENFRREKPYIPREKYEAGNIKTELNDKQKNSGINTDDKFLEDLKLVAMNVKLKPFNTVTEHISDLDMPSARFSKTKKYGVLNKFFEEYSFTTSGRGGNPVLLVLLDAGYELINATPTKNKGRGSLEHQWYQWKVSQWYTCKGYKTSIEEYIGKKLIDVYAEKADEKLAIEIEISKPKNISNYLKDANQGFSKVVIAVKDKVSKEKLEAVVARQNIDAECQVILLHEFL